jgi:hypothetical protein
VEECAAHGWLILDRAPLSRDAPEHGQLATAALAIARRYGDSDLEFGALALLGEAYVASGRVAEGMTFIDEAMAAVSAGEVGGMSSWPTSRSETSAARSPGTWASTAT